MFRVAPYKFLLVGLCFIGISSFLMQQSPSPLPILTVSLGSNHPSLGFDNFTGSVTTSDQVYSFLNFINTASYFFEDDTQQRLSYISNQMNDTYGTRSYGFSVIQQTNYVSNDWTITTYTNVYAGLAPGVDRLFPKNSYMFLFEPYISERVYLSKVGQKGSGITLPIQSAIFNIIFSVETDDTCKCVKNSAETIADQIAAQSGGYWNVFCSSNPETFILNIYPRKNRYIFTKPKNCYYWIYDNYWFPYLKQVE